MEQLGASCVGSFEGSLAKMSFDLLSGVFDTTFDVIEFVQAFTEGEQEVKGAGSGIAGGGGSDFTLDGGSATGKRGGHERFLSGGKNQRRVLFLPFSRYPNLPKLNTTI